MSVQITAENYEEEVLNSSEPVLIDFWAPWCGPCRMIGPVLEELAPKYEGRVKVVKINIDEEPELAQTFHVRSIPTLFAIKDGEVIDQMVGWGGKKKLEEAMDHLAKLSEKDESAA